MKQFVFPRIREVLRTHLKWTHRNLKPYTDEMKIIFEENRIDAQLVSQVQGPFMTRFEILPADAGSASRILQLRSTFRMVFRRSDLQIFRRDGRIFFDVPWQNDRIFLGDNLYCRDFVECRGIPIAVGMDLYRNRYINDLTDCPHLLTGGTGGSTRSDLLHGIMISVLLSCRPEDIEIYVLSGRGPDWARYRRLPYCHVENDAGTGLALLDELAFEMEKRQRMFASAGCDNIYEYCDRVQNTKPLFVLVTELEDLMDEGRRTCENALRRLASEAGACGIHLVLSSERPVIFRSLADEFPARLCLRVDNAADSLVMLDRRGAESLKRGLLYYRPAGSQDPILLQYGTVTSSEIRRVVSALEVNFPEEELLPDDPSLWDKLFSRA